jgi:hypothetical protein
MLEIDVPKHSIDALFDVVKQRLGNRVLGDFPFYTRVPDSVITESIGKWIDISEICTGYIYGHDETIPLHTDKWKSETYYNLNIPLYNTVNNQKFLVFDQEFPDRGCEWQVEGISQKRHQPLTTEDKSNSNEDNDHLESICYTGKRPCDTDILYCTNRDVNEDIVEHLPFHKDFYFGLSGKTWTQSVNKGLIFKTTQLHGTGIQNTFKVGCVLLLKSEDCLLTQ